MGEAYQKLKDAQSQEEALKKQALEEAKQEL